MGRVCDTGCGRPTRDVLLLCSGCLGVLRGDLGDVRWLDDQLLIVLSRQVALAEHAGGKAAEVPLPVDRRALDARSELRNRLVGWTRDLAELHGQDELPSDTLPAMAAWLLAREHRIAVHDAAGEIYAEIHEVVVEARRVVDLPANRTTFPVGPCPELTCVGEVRVFIPAEQSGQQPRMECQLCHRAWDTTQWSRTGRRILRRKGETPSSYVDTETAGVLLGVTDRTVRRWVTSGRLVNHGDERHVLVDLAEVERVVDAA